MAAADGRPTEQQVSSRTNRRIITLLVHDQVVEPEDRTAAQAVVNRQAGRAWVPWLMIGLGVLWVAKVWTYDGWELWARLVGGVFCVWAAWYAWRTRRLVLRHGAAQGLVADQIR